MHSNSASGVCHWFDLYSTSAVFHLSYWKNSFSCEHTSLLTILNRTTLHSIHFLSIFNLLPFDSHHYTISHVYDMLKALNQLRLQRIFVWEKWKFHWAFPSEAIHVSTEQHAECHFVNLSIDCVYVSKFHKAEET